MKWFNNTWWKRLILVVTAPLWFSIMFVLIALFFLAFLAWGILGVPSYFIFTGIWLDPCIDNWLRPTKD